MLSVGGLRQQFSLPENIQMSLFGADFIRDIKDHLGPEVEPNFTPFGYLVLSSEDGAETLQRNSVLQCELGARNELLTASKLKKKFPWLNTDGIALGNFNLSYTHYLYYNISIIIIKKVVMGLRRRVGLILGHFLQGFENALKSMGLISLKVK